MRSDGGALLRGRLTSREELLSLLQHYHIYGKLAKRGVRTNVDAHGEQPIGYLYHSEMLMMAMGGQEPYEALRHAQLEGRLRRD